MDPKKNFSFVGIMLLIVIVICWLTLSRIGGLEEELRQLRGELENMRSQVSYEVGSIKNIVEEEARWWTPGEVEIKDVEEGKASVKIAWNLKEYSEDVEVYLNYSFSWEDEHKRTAAERGADGHFFAVLPVEIPKEPVWCFNVSRSFSSNSTGSRVNQEIVHEGTREKDRFFLDYHISMKEGDKILASDKRRIDISKISYAFFNHMDLTVDFSEEDISVNLVELEMGDAKYEIKEVYLEKRLGENVLTRYQLEAVKEEQASPPMVVNKYSLEETFSKNYDFLYVVVEYLQGPVIEKEVPLLFFS